MPESNCFKCGEPAEYGCHWIEDDQIVSVRTCKAHKIDHSSKTERDYTPPVAVTGVEAVD